MNFQPPGSNPHTSDKALPFAALRAGLLLSSLHRLEGHLVSVSPEGAKGGFHFTLASTHKNDGGMHLQIRFEGDWANEAARAIRGGRLNRVLLLSAKNGKVEARPLPKDKAKEELAPSKRLRVTFREGVVGAWRGEDGKKMDRFSFKGRPPSAIPAARSFGGRGFPLASSSPPQPVPSTSSARHPSAHFPLQDIPSRTSLAPSSPIPDRLVVPLANPSNPYIGVGGGQPSPLLDLEHAPSTEAGATPAAAGVSSHDSGYEGSSPSVQRVEQEKGKGKEQQEAKEAPPAQPHLLPATSRKREASAGAEGGKVQSKKKQRKEKRTKWGDLKVGNFSYLALGSLPQQSCNEQAVIAMVVVTKEPYTTRNGDWSTELRLYDPTDPEAATQVNYFAQATEELPQPRDGDIVVLQRLNWSKDRNWFVAYKNKGQSRVLPASLLLSDPPTALSAFAPNPLTCSADIGKEELAYARDVAKWARKHDLLRTAVGTQAEAGQGADGQKPLPSKRRSMGRQTLRIEELEEDQFCDTIGEVVKYFIPRSMDAGPLSSRDQAALFITDYTSHPLLDDHPSSESSILGKRVLQVAIFGAQNEPLLARQQASLPGKLVRLRNVRPKMSGAGGFEVTMVEDQKYPENRDVTIVSDYGKLPPDWWTAFKKRRDAYWKLSMEDRKRLSQELTGAERPAPTEEEEQKPVDPLSEISNLTGLPSEPQSLSASLALNSPGTYRMRVRVVDFFPSRLEDWVVGWCPECDRDLSSSETTCIDHDKVDYEWAFRLVLADAEEGGKERVLVTVDGDAAFSLFPSFSSEALASLRTGDTTTLLDRLRGVLGDLDTRKRRKQPLRQEDWGPARDVVLEAVKGEGGKVEWGLKEGRVAFR